MNLNDYHKLVDEIGFDEYPRFFIPSQDYAHKIINYDEADLEVKIYLTRLILCRSFYGTYIAWFADVEWFINSFFKEFKSDLIKPVLTDMIKMAADMIMSKDHFTKGIIGTTFMFGVIEFYAKFKLGARPWNYNPDDPKRNDYAKQFKEDKSRMVLTMHPSFVLLQKQDLPISKSLNEIDEFTVKRLTEAGVKESKNKGIKYKIADRIVLARNPMLHGELHCFYETGVYLLMLCILFHLHDVKENVNT